MAETFHPGQRWMSESEPELGLGSVLRLTARTVLITFPATGETREYARDNAPLRRVQFSPGESVTSRDGRQWVVESVTERDGLLWYQGAGQALPESELNDALSATGADARLRAGQVDPPAWFDLRMAALAQQHQRRKSKVRGFVGGRIELIPHQLCIAGEVAARLVPRVLLADEVGLGKTIEACLIIHRLVLSGRAQRVLILVPESLVHQWFVELLRRFNLWFHIFDEDRCEAIEATEPDANPFLDDQLVLCSLSWLSENEARWPQVLAAGWDLLVVDEAHHLGWTPAAVSREYALVESLARRSPGLLLLTATPEQLGLPSHFARLRLLDPDRFYDLNEFLHESAQYREVAALAEKLLSNERFDGNDFALLGRILREEAEPLRAKLESAASAETRAEVIDALLDRHGTGRVMFRNTRAAIPGFPRRRARLYALKAPGREVLDSLREEFRATTALTGSMGFQPDYTADPRIVWLADFLRQSGEEKVLLICRTPAKVAAIEAALRQRINVAMATFHEGLSLVQRDRNAAWFGEEDGARLLICSEIGSEGRNFQFAHHLCLYDLPLDPELVEQRIGRLDRIGQRAEIQVHVPYVEGSAHEVFARWMHEGLDAFERNLQGGRELFERFGADVTALAAEFDAAAPAHAVKLTQLIVETQRAGHEIAVRLEQGRDRLLELNSFRPAIAKALVEEIRREDQDPSLERWLLSVFDHYSIQVEELSSRTYHLGSAGVFADAFPGLRAEGLTLTCDRQRALAREDVQFLTRDHPLVTGALDLILGSDRGNSSFAQWPDARTSGFCLEAVYVLECVAPPILHIDRFLPPTPLRVLVDHRGEELDISAEQLAQQLREAKIYPLFDRPEVREVLLPLLFEYAENNVRRRVAHLIAAARKAMTNQLGHEIARLEDLRRVNRSVRAEEVELLMAQQQALDEHLAAARLRLDAARLIQRERR